MGHLHDDVIRLQVPASRVFRSGHTKRKSVLYFLNIVFSRTILGMKLETQYSSANVIGELVRTWSSLVIWI